MRFSTRLRRSICALLLMRGAMRAVDASAPAVEQPEFLESHYHHFGLSSQHRRREMVIFIDPRTLPGFASLRYAAYYFALATQAIAILLELDDPRARVVRRYTAIVGEADAEVQRLVEAGQP